ncbi:MAG: restriction endonuclease subunit S [Chlorobi bacterium]|nr:MAG: N-6 DNA methylase [Chlorobi bacterium OLB7]MBK8910297.1 restriction endonuclease subunit S [Chlorobiota bacterium]
MNYIEQMVAELCPNGVEFRELGTLVERATTIRWQDVEGEEFQYIDLTSVDRTTHAIGETETITSENAPIRAQQIVHADDVIFGTTRPMLKRYCRIPAEYHGQVCSSGYCVLRAKTEWLLPNFLFHLIGTENFYNYVDANQRGASYPGITDRAVKAFRIPVPPLPIQQEIVRVLDLFMALLANLQAELVARRKQYQYYRDQLLSFEGREDVRWGTLGEIGQVRMCRRIFKHETAPEGDVPFFKIGTFGGTPDAFISQALYDEYRSLYSFPKKGDILLSAAGTIGRAIPYDGKDAYFQDSNIVWIDNSESVVSNKYLWHWYQIVEWSTDGGTIQRLYNTNLRQARIAVPSHAEQEEIVSLLDKFDALVNDLSIGLPAEIAARQKQYEYYRDRLLTFPEAAPTEVAEGL